MKREDNGIRRVRRFRFGRGSLRRDIDAEIGFHLQMLYDELVADGMDPAAARKEVRRRFGDAESHRRATRVVGEKVRRAAKRGEIMTDLLLDLKFALRAFERNPAYAAVAVATLALGLAANATIFGMTESLMLAPLPYEDSDELVFVWTTFPERGVAINSSSIPDWADYRARAETLEDLAAHRSWDAALTGYDEPMGLRGYRVSGTVFDMLGVAPRYGRAFITADDRPGADPVIVLSWRLFQRLGADPELVGSDLRINDVDHRVIGVMPERFEYPQMNFRGDLWTPARFTTEELTETRGSRGLALIGRLAEGATAEQATVELRGIAADNERDNPGTNTGVSARAVRIRDQLAEPMRPALIVLLFSVGFVLLICCANVANLSLARASSRSAEVAVRTALGASRGRIVRQLLTESVLIALAGGIVGYALSSIGGQLLVGSLPGFVFEVMPSVLEAGPSLGVFGATMALAVFAGIVFGVVPALRASGPNLQGALRSGSGSLAGSPRRQRLRAMLVIGEVAVSVVLIAGAGLMMKGFVGLLRTDPGFEPEGVLTLRVTLPEARYGDNDTRRQFYDRALEEVLAVPAVEMAGTSELVPLAFSNSTTTFWIEGNETPEAGQFPVAGYRRVSPTYLETMRTPLLAGRSIAATDREDAPPVFVVNKELAQRYFDGNALGARIRFNSDEEWGEIVGVVGDFHHSSLMEPPSPELFFPYAQGASRQRMYFVVRTSGDPAAMTADVREAIWRVDRALPIEDVSTLADRVDASLLLFRLPTNLMSVFAVAALLVAAVGLYGVLAYVVVQRSHEFGIRMALGARGLDVVQLVLRRALWLAGVGVVIGTVGAVLVGRVLASILEGVNGNEPLVFLGVPALLIVVTLLASLVPLRRALAVDPVVSMRSE